MGDVKFELNLAGLNELMKSSEMQNALLEAGQAVARNAGSEPIKVSSTNFSL